MTIRTMDIEDFKKIYDLWIHTEFIHHTTVKKEYRGQGIGQKLVDSAMKALEAEGIHKVALVAFEKNVSGNAFGEKVGL